LSLFFRFRFRCCLTLSVSVAVFLYPFPFVRSCSSVSVDPSQYRQSVPLEEPPMTTRRPPHTFWLEPVRVAMFLLLPLSLPAAAAPPGWPAYADAVVAADGSGQFHSLQDAIAAAPAGRPGRPWIIHVRPGTYRERLYVQREKRFLALVGEDAETTVVTFDLHANVPGTDGKPIGTFRTATAQIDADDFTAEGLTFENAAGPVGQALAIRVDGDRAAFRRCRFVGWQDTVLLNRGRQYFESCHVCGHVDFIFGGATAFFDRCTIVARGEGYLTAASTPEEQPYGFVFSRGTVRGETPEVRTYLGRPWRSFASTVFLDTEMTEVVRPEGWHNWSRPEREKTTRYAEHGSRGPGANPGARVPWARALDAPAAAALTPVTVLGGADGWDPASQASVVAAAPKAPVADTAPPCPPPARFERDVEYARPGGESLRLDACTPPGPGPFAAAILVHGGGWTSGERAQAARELRRPLTRAGIAWLAVSYRLAPQHTYPAPVEDVLAAVRWTQKSGRRLHVDGQRIALVGESAGGHLVADAAVRTSGDTPVAAVVPFFAPVDLESDTDRRGGLSVSMRALFGRTDLDETARAALRDGSPIRRVRPGLPPFLLVHGTADMSVPYEQSVRMQKALRESGVACDLITVPDGTHGTRDWDERLPGYADQVVAWIAGKVER
jgi:pectinesterase